jgi:hypothetical protein
LHLGGWVGFFDSSLLTHLRSLLLPPLLIFGRENPRHSPTLKGPSQTSQETLLLPCRG